MISRRWSVYRFHEDIANAAWPLSAGMPLRRAFSSWAHRYHLRLASPSIHYFHGWLSWVKEAIARCPPSRCFMMICRLKSSIDARRHQCHGVATPLSLAANEPDILAPARHCHMLSCLFYYRGSMMPQRMKIPYGLRIIDKAPSTARRSEEAAV